MTLKAVAPRGLGSLPALPGNKPSFLLLNHSQWSLPGLLCAGQPVSPFPDGLTMWLSCPPAASGGCCKSVVKEERTVKSITTTVQMGACDQGRLWSQIVLLCYCVIVLLCYCVISVQILAPSSTSRATARSHLLQASVFLLQKEAALRKTVGFVMCDNSCVFI